MSTENLVLVDGDIVVYRVGFASEGSSWNICKSRVDKMLTDILENTKSGVMFGYLTEGSKNYRNTIATTHVYKGNRSVPKPFFYFQIREYLNEYHGFEIHTTQEADDAIGIAHAELTNWKTDEPVIIASIDKDLLMIPGKHYSITEGVIQEISIPEARKKFYMQVLTGDRTDNIIGIKGVGPAKANKILIDSASTRYGTAVCKAYADANIPHSQERAMENAQLVWIRRELDYKFSFKYVDEVYNRYNRRI